MTCRALCQILALGALTAWFAGCKLESTACSSTDVSCNVFLLRRINLGPARIFPAPDTIAGLQLWLLADDVALANGASVPSWTDRSVNANNHTQGTGANQPVLQTNIVGGHSGLYFNGAKCLQGSNSNVSGADFSVFFVALRTQSAASDSLYEVGTAALNFNKQMGFSAGGANTFDFCSRNSGCITGAPGATPSAFHLYGQTYLGSTTGAAEAYVDGTLGNSATLVQTMNAAGISSIGSPPNGCGGMDGTISEIIYYNRVLSAAEIKTVHCYLNNRYAIGSSSGC